MREPGGCSQPNPLLNSLHQGLGPARGILPASSRGAGKPRSPVGPRNKGCGGAGVPQPRPQRPWAPADASSRGDRGRMSCREPPRQAASLILRENKPSGRRAPSLPPSLPAAGAEPEPEPSLKSPCGPSGPLTTGSQAGGEPKAAVNNMQILAKILNQLVFPGK